MNMTQEELHNNLSRYNNNNPAGHNILNNITAANESSL